jgi:hypothetical protein
MGKNLTTCEASASSLRTVWRARPVRLIISVGLLLVVAIATAGSFAIANLRNNMLADSDSTDDILLFPRLRPSWP